MISSYVQEKLPPTDSRLRPDQRYLENGEFDMANSEKLRLEQRQRQVTCMLFFSIPGFCLRTWMIRHYS
jgi:hypothetical protein